MAGWVKRLRQRLRNRRPALILASFIVLALTVGVRWYASDRSDQADHNQEAAAVLAAQKLEMVIQNRYLLGPMVEERRTFSTKEMDQFHELAKNLTFIKEEQGKYIFERKVDDLSPVLKDKGVIGVDRNGMLTLYEGDPKENNVIQTFFQIDLERLETSLPAEEINQLQQGIHFSSLAEFNSILSTYGEYAVMSHDEEEREIR